METKDKLTASEALFLFCGWLTTRKTPTIMSGNHEAGNVAELIREFCEKHQLQSPRDNWIKNV